MIDHLPQDTERKKSKTITYWTNPGGILRSVRCDRFKFERKFTVLLGAVNDFGVHNFSLLDPPFPTGILIETFLDFKVETATSHQPQHFGRSRKMTSACK